MPCWGWGGGGGFKLPRLLKLPIYDFDLRATHARTLLPVIWVCISSSSSSEYSLEKFLVDMGPVRQLEH